MRTDPAGSKLGNFKGELEGGYLLPLGSADEPTPYGRPDSAVHADTCPAGTESSWVRNNGPT